MNTSKGVLALLGGFFDSIFNSSEKTRDQQNPITPLPESDLAEQAIYQDVPLEADERDVDDPDYMELGLDEEALDFYLPIDSDEEIDEIEEIDDISEVFDDDSEESIYQEDDWL